MSDGMGWVLALVALVVAGAIGWWLKGRRRTPPEVAPEAPAAPTVPASPPATPPSVEAAPAPRPSAEVPAPGRPRPVAPPVPRPAPPRTLAAPAPSPVPKAGVAAPMVEPPPVRPALPRVARFELRDERPEPVMTVERAGAAAWEQGRELQSTPVQRELLGGLLAQALQLDAGTAGSAADGCVVRLRRGAAWGLAQGDIVIGAAQVVPPGAIDPACVPDFAAAMLAVHAARRALPELHAEVGEIKTAVSALHPKLIAQTEGRAKSLMQDLARYLREAEENFAGAIRKPIFLERVAQSCQQSAAIWQAAQMHASAARATLHAQSQAPRFGEVQLERTVAALRDLQGQRRVLDVAARLLSGWTQLRQVLGQREASAGQAVADTARSLTAGVADDQALATVLSRCLDDAKAPDYVGKAEFAANRNAARELVDALGADALQAAGSALARVSAAFAAPRAEDEPLALLLKIDAQARVLAVREPTSPAAS